ncbi:CU044_2847 family protein [Pseudorhodoferax sp.]|uniref:CU044_2847 family protein n=1 Tax=Pseudorhodoferax sp. TaxID=1993553 RepID=UPI0039E45A79
MSKTIDVEVHETGASEDSLQPGSLSPRVFGPKQDIGEAARLVKPIDAALLRDHISGIVSELAGGLKPSPDGPKSCEITFSVKIGAEGNVIVSKFAAQAQLQVKVTWER